MINRKPEGYKDLLVYQKAVGLQQLTLQLTDRFPKTKTLLALQDQMDRSGRSGTKNIVEGWKRNTTREYFTFLGFSIGSLEELKDDCADIAKGLYRELKGVRGVMGEKIYGAAELEKLRFYPLDVSLPPVVQLYLRCKEVLMLLNKLQKSLDTKMAREHTKPKSELIRQKLNETKEFDKWLVQEAAKLGLKRQENGKFVRQSPDA